ncbi:MAG TPA: formate dehydrogenase subunit delta [Rhodoferax sp.]
MTTDDNLIRMANQIGTFFESMPDRTEALEGIARHLKNFWDPRMRRALLAQVDAADNPDIHDIVLAAVHAHRALLH